MARKRVTLTNEEKKKAAANPYKTPKPRAVRKSAAQKKSEAWWNTMNELEKKLEKEEDEAARYKKEKKERRERGEEVSVDTVTDNDNDMEIVEVVEEDIAPGEKKKKVYIKNEMGAGYTDKKG